MTFTGPRYGEALARAYAGADVFVFPSLTDTFGLVILEALACGTPVAAFPVTGPKDVLMDADGKIGAVHTDLRVAAMEALTGGPCGLPGARRAIFVASLRRDFPVASRTTDGRAAGRQAFGLKWGVSSFRLGTQSVARRVMRLRDAKRSRVIRSFRSLPRQPIRGGGKMNIGALSSINSDAHRRLVEMLHYPPGDCSSGACSTGVSGATASVR